MHPFKFVPKRLISSLLYLESLRRKTLVSLTEIQDFKMYLYNRNSFCPVLRLKGIYEEQTVKFIKNSSSAGIFIDVGANVGYFTLISSSLFDSVFAFEPEPINFQILKANIQINKFKNVYAYNYACSSHNSISFLKIAKTHGGHYLTKKQDKDTIAIETRRLDSILSETEYISVLKIDVEGKEDEVLTGCSQLLKNNQIDSVIVEYNESSFQNCKKILFDHNFHFESKLDRNLLFIKN